MARTRDLGLGGSNIDRLAVGNMSHASVNTVEGASGTTEDRDLGDAQLVVYLVSTQALWYRGEGRRCILIAVYWPVVLKVSLKEASAAPWKTTLATAWFTSGTGLAMTVAARAERMVTMVNCILLVEVGWLVGWLCLKWSVLLDWLLLWSGVWNEVSGWRTWGFI